MYIVVLTVMMLVYQLVNIPQAMAVQVFVLHFRIDLYPIKKMIENQIKNNPNINRNYIIFIDSTTLTKLRKNVIKLFVQRKLIFLLPIIIHSPPKNVFSSSVLKVIRRIQHPFFLSFKSYVELCARHVFRCKLFFFNYIVVLVENCFILKRKKLNFSP